MKYGMNLFLWTDDMHDDMLPVLEQIKKIGFDGVEVPLRRGHADRHREALAERAGGAFHPRQLEILRMPGTGAADLAEIADVVQAHGWLVGALLSHACKMQDRV